MRAMVTAAVLAMVVAVGACGDDAPKSAETAPVERTTVTRQELMAVAAAADVGTADYEEYTLKDGRPAVKVQQPQRGIMLALIGPPADVSEVVAIITATENTYLQRGVMLADLAALTSRWNDGGMWVLNAITETAKANGGQRTITKNGHTITVATSQPAIIRLNVSRD